MRNVYTLFIGFCLLGMTVNVNATQSQTTTPDCQINALDFYYGDLSETQMVYALEQTDKVVGKTLPVLIQAYRAGGVLITVIKDDQTGREVVVTVDNSEIAVFIPRGI